MGFNNKDWRFQDGDYAPRPRPRGKGAGALVLMSAALAAGAVLFPDTRPVPSSPVAHRSRTPHTSPTPSEKPRIFTYADIQKAIAAEVKRTKGNPDRSPIGIGSSEQDVTPPRLPIDIGSSKQDRRP